MQLKVLFHLDYKPFLHIAGLNWKIAERRIFFVAYVGFYSLVRPLRYVMLQQVCIFIHNNSGYQLILAIDC